MSYMTETRAYSLTLGQRFADLRARLADAAEKRRVFRTTYAELDALSNRDLADLGLHRSAIKSIAYEAAYGA